MSRILLFRFHKDTEVAVDRLRMLRYFNPNLPIYILFGGEDELAEDAEKSTRDYAEGFWRYDQERPPEWKWQHGDLMVKAWYRAFGHRIDFDHVYSYEYDLLTLAPLDKLYPEVGRDDLALTAAEPFTEYIENRWSWTSREPRLSKYKKFKQYMLNNYGVERQANVCLGPGMLLSRTFLDKYANTEDVDLVHDELAVPAFAEVFGLKIRNTGFHSPFFERNEEWQFFNCVKGHEPSLDLIFKTLRDGHKRRAFHPVKERAELSDFINII